MEPLELRFTVACSPAYAFEVWTAKTSLWWPRDHSVSGAPGLAVTFEPGAGGRIYERTPEGVEHEWGEILFWEPPQRLAYLWHIASDRSDATEVDITFTGDSATTVTIVHRGWDRLGARGPDRRERNRRGWIGLIPHYRHACLEAPASRTRWVSCLVLRVMSAGRTCCAVRGLGPVTAGAGIEQTETKRGYLG